jgi:hypothetical protein
VDHKVGEKCVVFEHALDVAMTGVDGTWRRDCKLAEISDSSARLIVYPGMDKLNVEEFFLLLTPNAGAVFRRCELTGINGREIEVRFLTKSLGLGQMSTLSHDVTDHPQNDQGNYFLGPQRLRY